MQAASMIRWVVMNEYRRFSFFLFSPNPTHFVHFVGVQLFICRGWWALLLYAKRVRCFIALESKSLFHGTKMKSVAPFFRLPWWAKSVESLTSGVNPGINPHTMFDQACLNIQVDRDQLNRTFHDRSRDSDGARVDGTRGCGVGWAG